MASGHALPQGFDAGPAHHSGRIDTNEVWHPSGNPHILDGDVYTGDSVTLTIMPGCTVQVSADAELYTGYANPGSIIAVGKADSMIAFTSLSDTVPGSWNCISFYPRTISTARLSYVVVEHAGGGGARGGVQVDGCEIRMDHCTVRKNAVYGVYCGALGYFADFSSNTITASGASPVRIQADYVRTLGTGNTLTGNVHDDILVTGQNVKTSGIWLNHSVPYVIYDDVAVEGDNSPVLTIAAGTTVKMGLASEFYVGYAAPGGLIADGTAAQITFTSLVTPSSPGDWDMLSFYDNSMDSQCQLKNCKVEFAGYDNRGNIYIADCTPRVVGCDIGYSSAYGIYLTGLEYPDPDTLRAYNSIHDYVSGDIRVPGVGVGERPLGPSCAKEPATVVHGALFLGDCPRTGTVPRTVLIDISGRKVLDLHAGANDVSHLSPGVYFVRRAQAQAQAVRKVVIQR